MMRGFALVALAAGLGIAVACSSSDDPAGGGGASDDGGTRADGSSGTSGSTGTSGGGGGTSGSSGSGTSGGPKKDTFFDPPLGADMPVPDNSCIAHCTDYPVAGKIEDVARPKGVPWTDVANAASPDGSLASVTLNAGQESDYLYVSDFGFDNVLPKDVQTGTALTGVTVALKRWAEGKLQDVEFSIVITGKPTGNHLFPAWPSDVGSHHYGQAVDPWFTDDLFPKDVTTKTFGAHVAVKRTEDAGAGPVTAHIDAMRIAVCYCNPDGK